MENKGVDPKTYGAFDKFMDKVSNSKLAKGIGLSAALAMAASPNAVQASQPPAEVSSLPSGHGDVDPRFTNATEDVNMFNGPSLVQETQQTKEIVWVDNLLKSLGEDYFKKSSTDIWYRDPVTGREFPVLLGINSKTGVFQFDAKKRDANGNRIVSGRGEVRVVDSQHAYVFPETTFVVVSNSDKRVFTYDEVSKTWMETLAGDVISGYVENPDGSKEVMIWRRNVTEAEKKNFSEVGDNGTGSSGYKIDFSGALVAIK